ncbi:dentin sialophosphoprotein-like isoform X2 [Pecten maximus]|uniref:dentin sialophosphoprotein-like isoform X2 n=1 Tax=Pecten maximus TaxID=6579 RepID=UPI001458DC9D|nr:dentin sialophosphoprotein-like isoform X2 [Pecten maximus]
MAVEIVFDNPGSQHVYSCPAPLHYQEDGKQGLLSNLKLYHQFGPYQWIENNENSAFSTQAASATSEIYSNQTEKSDVIKAELDCNEHIHVKPELCGCDVCQKLFVGACNLLHYEDNKRDQAYVAMETEYHKEEEVAPNTTTPVSNDKLLKMTCKNCGEELMDDLSLSSFDLEQNSSQQFCVACLMSDVVDSIHGTNDVFDDVTQCIEYECSLCTAVFLSRTEIRKHFDTHDRIQNHVCPFCDQQFSDGEEFYDHFRSHEKNQEFTCRVCEKVFTCESIYQFHVKSHRILDNLRRPHCAKQPSDIDECYSANNHTHAILRKDNDVITNSDVIATEKVRAVEGSANRLGKDLTVSVETSPQGSDDNVAPDVLPAFVYEREVYCAGFDDYSGQDVYPHRRLSNKDISSNLDRLTTSSVNIVGTIRLDGNSFEIGSIEKDGIDENPVETDSEGHGTGENGGAEVSSRGQIEVEGIENVQIDSRSEKEKNILVTGSRYQKRFDRTESGNEGHEVRESHNTETGNEEQEVGDSDYTESGNEEQEVRDSDYTESGNEEQEVGDSDYTESGNEEQEVRDSDYTESGNEEQEVGDSDYTESGNEVQEVGDSDCIESGNEVQEVGDSDCIESGNEVQEVRDSDCIESGNEEQEVRDSDYTESGNEVQEVRDSDSTYIGSEGQVVGEDGSIASGNEGQEVGDSDYTVSGYKVQDVGNSDSFTSECEGQDWRDDDCEQQQKVGDENVPGDDTRRIKRRPKESTKLFEEKENPAEELFVLSRKKFDIDKSKKIIIKKTLVIPKKQPAVLGKSHIDDNNNNVNHKKTKQPRDRNNNLEHNKYKSILSPSPINQSNSKVAVLPYISNRSGGKDDNGNIALVSNFLLEEESLDRVPRFRKKSRKKRLSEGKSNLGDNHSKSERTFCSSETKSCNLATVKKGRKCASSKTPGKHVSGNGQLSTQLKKKRVRVKDDSSSFSNNHLSSSDGHCEWTSDGQKMLSSWQQYLGGARAALRFPCRRFR